MPDILEQLAETEDGVYAVDMNQRIVFWNRAAERILGHRAEDVVGKRCYQVIGGLSEEQAEVCTSNCTVILLAHKGRIAPSHTYLVPTKQGPPKWITVTHILLPGARRDLNTLVHIFHDSTESVEAKRLVERFKGLVAQGPPASPAPVRSADKPDADEVLSPREREVLRLLAKGLRTEAIAKELVLQPTTVRNHIQHVLAKLGAHSRLEAVAAASVRGFL